MNLIDHPVGKFRFLQGTAPYSRGVVSAPGSEIVHVTLHRPVPYRHGFDRIEQHLDTEGRPRAALCGIELRSPRPYTFAGFGAFNAEYAQVLASGNLFVSGVNPIARTNVAPAIGPPGETVLYGFSYARPSNVPERPTFVVAGAGELPEEILTAEAIVWSGETSAEAIAHKAEFVLDVMEDRLRGLGVDWSLVTAVDVYTVHPIHHVLPEMLLIRIGPAAVHGVRWFYSRPPIVGLEFEMDVRGVGTEIRMD